MFTLYPLTSQPSELPVMCVHQVRAREEVMIHHEIVALPWFPGMDQGPRRDGMGMQGNLNICCIFITHLPHIFL